MHTYQAWPHTMSKEIN